MFTNKKDPLVDAVKSVMNEGNLKRQVEEDVNNHFGVYSRKAIPHEQRARYDAALEEAHKYAMKEEEGSTPRNEKEAKLAAMKEPRHKITHADVLKGRGVIKQEETQLDEKAVSKAQHRFFGLVRGIQKGEAKGSAEAEKAAKEMSAKEVRKFAKTKEKGLPERVDEAKYKGTGTGSSIFKPHKGDYHVVDAGGKTVMVSNMEKDAHEIAKRFGKGHKVIAADNFEKNMNEQPKNIQKESVETIMEEIRTNLEEQLVDAYESGDAQMFENFVLSLNEEQREILGLNERLGLALKIGQKIAASPLGSRISSALSTARGTGGRPPPIDGGRLTPVPSPASSTAIVPRTTPPVPAVRPSTPPAGAPPAGGTQSASGRNLGLGTGAAIAGGAAAELATSSSLTNTDSNDPGGSYDAGPDSNDPGGRSYDAAPTQKPAARQTAPTQKPATSTREKTPDLDAPGAVGGGFSLRRASELGFNESTHIRESLESFIRNKFIKG